MNVYWFSVSVFSPPILQHVTIQLRDNLFPPTPHFHIFSSVRQIILNVLFKVITSQPLEDIRDFKEDGEDEVQRQLGNGETGGKKGPVDDELLRQRISPSM